MGTTFQIIITEFDSDSNRKVLGQTFSDESILTKNLSFGVIKSHIRPYIYTDWLIKYFRKNDKPIS